MRTGRSGDSLSLTDVPLLARHLSESASRYLKRGVKPVPNKVPDSEGPPDFWASEYTLAKIGPYPMPSFPTAQEQEPK